MCIFAQSPSPDEVIKAATSVSWEAGMLALIIVAAMGLVGYMARAMTKRHLDIEDRIVAEGKQREERLSNRVTHLEDLIRVELMSVVKENSITMGKVLSAADSICKAADRMTSTLERFTLQLENRPCLFKERADITKLFDELKGTT